MKPMDHLAGAQGVAVQFKEILARTDGAGIQNLSAAFRDLNFEFTSGFPNSTRKLRCEFPG
jgi:hypothetical protein